MGKPPSVLKKVTLSPDGLAQSGRGRGGKKFVALNASRDAFAAVVWLDPYDLREAADVHIAGHGDLARQGENKFDSTFRFKICVNQKIEAAKTNVPRLSLSFDPAVRPACPNRKRKSHRESPRGSAFCWICHHSPEEDAPGSTQRSIAEQKSQREIE